MKRISVLLLAGAMMASMSVTALANDIEQILPNQEQSQTLNGEKQRIAKTTKKIKLNSVNRYYSSLFSNNNWTDIRVTLTNNANNPGAIKVQIIAEDKDGQLETIDESDAISPGGSWTSEKIASSYANYEVKVMATELTGTYSITYDDI